MRTQFVTMIEVHDGYNGKRTWIAIVIDENFQLFAVHRAGYFRTSLQGIAAVQS